LADLFEPENPDDRIVDEPIGKALSERYLTYALSTITARALPDVRDGLKPVHRRILFAMRELGLDPTGAFKKCARIVGDVIGKFHPHGDTAAYDALVRLAQDFSVRYPLIDGQGNFGNVDGDGAAAYRYTEARLTVAAELLLAGLNEDAVDFRQTYNMEDEEPVVLPAGFPNLLANGSSGIAVGMATSIPPHNAGELIEACKHIIANPLASAADLMAFVPGPDFPTGGVLVEPADAIREAYATGRGAFRLRARWTTEDLGRGMWRIVVTEIPYQVQKAKLIEKLAELIETKKAPLVADVRDESAEDVRLVIEPRARTVEPAQLMESLFRQCDLEVRFPLNLNVLDAASTPRVMSLREALQGFLDHQRDVVVRRARWRLGKIDARIEILDGYLIVYLNLDEVIRIIREEDHPKAALIEAFKLTETQADAILDMRLRNLRKLEEMELKRERKALADERKGLKALLGDDALQWGKVAENLDAAKAALGKDPKLGDRRTTIEAAPTLIETPIDAFVPKEAMTVVLSKKGWIRALKGHLDDLSPVKFRDGDELHMALKCWSTDQVCLFATDGRSFSLAVDKLPGGRGGGDAVRMLVELAETEDVLALFVAKAGSKRLVASSGGYGFVVPEEEFVAAKRAGKVVLVPGDEGAALICHPLAGDWLGVIGENRKVLCFPLAEVPEMARGKGVKLQTYKDGGLADVTSFAEADGLGWTDSGGRRRSLPEWREYVGKRAGAGRLAPKGFPRSGRFTG
jgi:topoisomerase IV subunit A